MDDMEKNRIEYVARLEAQIQELQRQLSEVKPLAEKWMPVIGAEMTQSGDARITVGFGGKRVTATVANSALVNNTANDLIASVADTLAESLFVEKIREVISPEVERLQNGAKAIQGAGTWLRG